MHIVYIVYILDHESNVKHTGLNSDVHSLSMYCLKLTGLYT
jgi:hypothetical protein